MSPLEIALDAMLEKDGAALIYHPLFNYLPGDLSFVQEMLEHPHTRMGLSDGGAHCGVISDVSFPTTLLQHWGRDRTAGPKLPLPQLVSSDILPGAGHWIQQESPEETNAALISFLDALP